MCEIPHGEGNETFLIIVCKPLPSRRVLKTLRESPKRTISASYELRLLQRVKTRSVGLGCCKWQTHTPCKGVETYP